jgi:hypothetical protein
MMDLSAVHFVTSAKEALDFFELAPTDRGLFTLLARLASEVFAARVGDVNVQRPNPSTFEAVTPSGTITAKPRMLGTTWLSYDEKLGFNPVYMPPQPGQLANFVYDWKIKLPSAERDAENRVTRRPLGRDPQLLEFLVALSKTSDVLRMECELTSPEFFAMLRCS